MAADIKVLLNEKKEEIDRTLEKYLPRKLDNAALGEIFGKATYAYDEKALTDALSVPIWDFLDRGGKRFRPAIFMLVAEAMGADLEKAGDFAAVVEFAHEGSIMIDDIEDMGELRRGKPCTHRAFGEDMAINAGNFMYFLPARILISNRSNYDGKTILRAWEVFGQEMINIHAGQAMDIYWHKGGQEEIGEDEYMQMCSYKTGCLTRMAAKLAAVLSGADDIRTERIGRFAERLGVGFQIQDDVLSASSSDFQDKKGYGDDVTEGKRTLIVIHALKHSDEKDRRRLLEILGMHTRDRGLIKEALDILQKNGSVQYAKEKAKHLVKKAWKDADAVLPESEAKQKLKSLADYLIERDI